MVSKIIKEWSTEKVPEVIEAVKFVKLYISPYYKDPVPVYNLKFSKFDYNQMFPVEKDFEENISNSILAYDRNLREFNMINLEIGINPLKKMGITKPQRLLYISCGDIKNTEPLTKEESAIASEKKIVKKRKKRKSETN